MDIENEPEEVVMNDKHSETIPDKDSDLFNPQPEPGVVQEEIIAASEDAERREMNYCEVIDGIPIRLHVGDKTYSFEDAAELISKQTAELERLKQPLEDERLRILDRGVRNQNGFSYYEVGECLQGAIIL